MRHIYLLNYPSFNKHLIPRPRQARAPVILLYFEELREVAGKATAYYITTDKIERQDEKDTEERRRETHWERLDGKVFSFLFFFVALLDWAAVGYRSEQQRVQNAGGD